MTDLRRRRLARVVRIPYIIDTIVANNLLAHLLWSTANIAHIHGGTVITIAAQHMPWAELLSALMLPLPWMPVVCAAWGTTSLYWTMKRLLRRDLTRLDKTLNAIRMSLEFITEELDLIHTQSRRLGTDIRGTCFELFGNPERLENIRNDHLRHSNDRRDHEGKYKILRRSTTWHIFKITSYRDLLAKLINVEQETFKLEITVRDVSRQIFEVWEVFLVNPSADEDVSDTTQVVSGPVARFWRSARAVLGLPP